MLLNPWIVKGIGSVIVIGACSLMGVQASKYQEKRLNELIALKKVLHMLMAEINYSTPLPYALKQIGGRQSKALGEMVLEVGNILEEKCGEDFYSVWKHQIEVNKNRLFFNDEDIRNLIDFGSGVGYLDKQMQEKNITMLLSYIEVEVAQINKTKNQTSKMYRSIGVLGGLLLAIVLL